MDYATCDSLYVSQPYTLRLGTDVPAFSLSFAGKGSPHVKFQVRNEGRGLQTVHSLIVHACMIIKPRRSPDSPVLMSEASLFKHILAILSL